jgi:type IV pilus assembly protein PilM
MTTLFHRSVYSPIGLDIRHAEIHAAQFRIRGSRTNLSAAASEFVDREMGAQGELAALRSLIGTGRFRGKSVVCSLRNEEVHTRPLLMRAGITPDDPGAFRDALLEEVQTTLGIDPENAVVDYLPFGMKIMDDEERFSILLVAVGLEAVNRYVSMFKAAGLHCAHMDIGPCALNRIMKNEDRTYCLINLDDDCSQVSIGKGGNLLFSRTLRFGTRTMIGELMQALSLSETDAVYLLQTYGCATGRVERNGFAGQPGQADQVMLASAVYEVCSKLFDSFAVEVKRSIDYYMRQREHGVVEESMILGTRLPCNIENFLRERLSVPVSSLRVFERLGIGHASALRDGDRYAVATGLALRDAR